MQPRLPLAASLALLLLLLHALAAPAETTVLAGDGVAVRVLAGSYAELFPQGGHGVAPAHRVLALERLSGGAAVRTLVPGTGGPEQEGLAELVLEPDSGRVFVVWSDLGGLGDAAAGSRLQLVSFADGVFSAPVEVSGDPLSTKTPVQLAVTRDPYGDQGKTRTIAHVVWHEVTEQRRTFYTPLVFQDGAYLGWNAVVMLDSLDRLAADGAAEPAAPALYSSFALDSGADQHSAVLVMPVEGTRRVLSVRLRVLPQSLLALADDARSHIIGVGNRSTGGGILSLAEQARSHIIGVGARLHAGVVSYIAEQGYQDVLEQGAEFEQGDLPAISSRLWDRVIAAGASITGSSLQPEELPCSVLHLGASPEVSTQPLHQVELCVVSARPAPGLVTGQPSWFISEDGARVLVAWERDGALRFAAGTADGWSAEQSLPAGLARDQALGMVRALARP